MTRGAWLGALALAVQMSSAFAWDLPHLEVQKAVQRASMVVLGRIQALHEVETNDARTIADAEVQVRECFLGQPCRAGGVITVRFLSRSYLEEVDRGFGIPTELGLSETVLFAFGPRRSIEHPLSFNFDVHANGVDHLYVVSDVPGDHEAWQADQPRCFFGSARSDRCEKVRRSEIRSWAAR